MKSKKNPEKKYNQELEEKLNHIFEIKALKLYDNKIKFFFINFMIGVVRGVGTVFGATVVIAVLVFILTRLEWIPFIGDTISEVANYLQDNDKI